MSSSLPSGTYTITNLSYRNRAGLTKGDDQEYVHCKLPGPVGLREQWKLTSYPGDRYLIENEDCKLHVATHPGAAVANPVFGTRVNASMSWLIKEVSGDEYGIDVYSIHSEELPTLSWTLNDGRDGTPISLQNFTKDTRSLWQISAYPPVQHKEFPFKDRSNMVLSSIGQTAQADYLAVYCEWTALPPGYVFEFPEPLLLLHHSEIVAEMIAPADGRFLTDSGRIYLEFHPRDTPAFKTFAAAVLTECDVQVYMQIKKFRFYHVGPFESEANKSYVYRCIWNKELTFKGLHSFQECVNVKNLKIHGSGEDKHGPYINATTDVVVTNPSLLTCTSNLVVNIYYGQCKLGIADLKDFTVNLGLSTICDVNWKFRPMSPATDELRTFFDKCCMTTMLLPLKLSVDTVSTSVCGRLFNLPRFSVDTHVEGCGFHLIGTVNVHLSLTTLFKRELGFDFDILNPFGTTIELQNVQVQVSIRGTHVATVKHAFSGPGSKGPGKLVISAHSSAVSPRIPNCWLNASYLKAFQLAFSAKTPLDIHITSADILVDKYLMKGLSYNLYDIPFRLHIL